MVAAPTPVRVPTMCSSPGRPPRKPPPKAPAGGCPFGAWPLGTCPLGACPPLGSWPVGAWLAAGAPAGRPEAFVELLLCSNATTSAPITRPASSQAPVDIQVARPRRAGPPAWISSAYAGVAGSGASRKSSDVGSAMGPSLGAVTELGLAAGWQVAVSGRQRQAHPERRAATRRLVHPDRPPVRHDPRRNDRQAQAGPARGRGPG